MKGKTVTNVNKEHKLGAKVKEKREGLELSQTKLAEMTGISIAEVCRIESGERANPSIAILINLGRSLGLSNEEFIDFIGYVPPADDQEVDDLGEK